MIIGILLALLEFWHGVAFFGLQREWTNGEHQDVAAVEAGD